MDFSKVRKALEQKGFSVCEFETAEEAAAYLDEKIDGTAVSFGGSVTLTELGLHEKLAAHNEIYNHWNIPAGLSADEVREKAMSTEVYVASVNALAETGEIVNIDGTGNRVASTIFGHKRLYLVVGCNKIEPDLSAAIYRARNVAAPLNAKRLKRNTPCVIDGKCHDCQSPECICSVMSIHRRPARGTETEIILVNQTLGY